MKVVGLRRDGTSDYRYRRSGYWRGRLPRSDHDPSEGLTMRFDSPDTRGSTLRRSRARGEYVLEFALLTLLAATISWWPAFPSAAQAADDKRPSQLESTVDGSITPGDDFFAYANGGWLKATAIPAGKERWGGRDELQELTRR